MQETFYQTKDFKSLAISVIEKGDLVALNELAKIITEIDMSGSYLNDLNTLILYYLYYFWMPEDLKKDFQVFKKYLVKDELVFWEFMLRDSSLLNEEGYSDIYQLTINDLVNDIVYRYFNGAIGKQRDVSDSIFKVLATMFKNNYQQINDHHLKILFLGYDLYGRDLFGSDAEFYLFKNFLFDKISIIYADPNNCNPQQESIEEMVSEMNLV